MVKELKDLRVYQQAMDLAQAVHQASLSFPEYARNELGRQMRLSGDSIPANIAEGYGRKQYSADFRRFLVNALGSCTELGCQLEMAWRYRYLDQASYQALDEKRDHLGRSLHRLIARLGEGRTADL